MFLVMGTGLSEQPLCTWSDWSCANLKNFWVIQRVGIVCFWARVGGASETHSQAPVPIDSQAFAYTF